MLRSFGVTLCWIILLSICSARDVDPFPIPANKKGLQVQMLDDAIALGVQHAALNCDLMRWPALKADPTDHLWTSAGREFRFSASAVRDLDARVKPMSDAGAVVYVILLNYISGDSVRDELLLHPGAIHPAPNRIAAFNTVTPEGRAWLTATAEFIAARYSGNNTEQAGRVWGYIVGNEVNSHWQWYNLGRANADAVVEAYEAAVRIFHSGVRRSSANARIYISMDHHWTIGYASGGADQALPGRTVLDAFARHARAGGDYDWHMAYHPYPEDLGNPRTWTDRTATESEDSPRITFKNLHVLERYMRRPELLWEGEPRRIILSEQGFHCRETDPDGEDLQAAAFCYAWFKTESLRGVDAFILHRHVDHAMEGGLNLGLWTRKSGSTSTPDRKRKVYDVFRAAGTSEAPAAFRFALPFIGIESWDALVPDKE